MVAILHADIEAEFIGYMKSALQARPEAYASDVRVSNQVPNESSTQAWPTSGRLVVVRDDGGPAKWWGQAAARLGVRVWAADEAEASDLANLVAALIGDWRDEVVRWSSTTRPHDVTEQSGRPCMYFTSELLIHGRKLPAA